MLNSRQFTALVAIAATIWLPSPTSGNVLPHKARQTDFKWVDTWTSMPQLVEPDNLPAAPFVSRFQEFLIVLDLNDNRKHPPRSSTMPPSAKPSTCPSARIKSASRSLTPSAPPRSPSPASPSHCQLAERPAPLPSSRPRSAASPSTAVPNQSPSPPAKPHTQIRLIIR